jgi:hypothetical protein
VVCAIVHDQPVPPWPAQLAAVHDLAALVWLCGPVRIFLSMVDPATGYIEVD